MNAPIFHLNGLPASGKLTIAKAMAKHTPTTILDNHVFLDFVSHFVPRNTKAREQAIVDALDLGLRAIENHETPNTNTIVFTNVLVDEVWSDRARWERITHFAEKMNRPLFPVVVNCPTKVCLQRVENPDRKTKHKLTNTDVARMVFEESKSYTLMTMSTHPHRLDIDSSTQSVDNSAKSIFDHVTSLGF